MPIRTAMCLNCGNVYLVDFLTADSYDQFYRSYYRVLISHWKDRPHTSKGLFTEQSNFADSLISRLSGFINLSSSSQIIDVGGSTGKVAKSFATAFGAEVTVIDPSPEEVAIARELGINAHVSTIEKWESNCQYDLILLCNTFEHLYDPQRAFKKMQSLLNPNGFIYCDIADIMELCRTEGAIDAVAKIDHCNWLSFDIAPGLFRSLGLEIVWAHFPNIVQPTVGYLLRSCEPEQVKFSEEMILSRLARLQQIKSDWLLFGQQPQDLTDRLRHKAYRAKKWLNASLPMHWINM